MRGSGYERDNWWETRNNAQPVLDQGRKIARIMRENYFSRRLSRQWRQMRNDLNKLARTYQLRPV